MGHLRKPLCLLIIFSLTIFLTGLAQAKTESINVEPGKDLNQTIDLVTGDRTSLSFTVLGSSSPITIHFYIVLPNGTISDHGEISQFTFGFFTEVEGECQLHFDNGNSSDTKLVTLNYEVEHHVFGIPQLFFLLVAITLLLLCVAAGYIVMGKYG